MANESTTESRTPATEAVAPPPTAVPAVPLPPEAEDYETWPLDDLMRVGAAGFARAEQRHLRWITLGRQNVEDKLDVGHILSIAQERVKDEREWCALQGKYGLKRTTVWEYIQAYRRSAAAGHTKQEVAANHETWTEVLIAYGVVKERRKKQDMPAPVHAEPVVNEATVGQGEAVTAGSAIGQEGGPVAAEVPPDAATGTAPLQDQPHEDDAKAEADTGNAEIDTSAKVEPSATTIGTEPGASVKAHCRANPAKAKKVQAKEQKELTPCEIDAGNALLKVAGTWDRAMHVLETLKALAGD